ncbi:MAG TPA: sigma 54-interacting transcriptional regulator [Planctomycetaceae bacterium]|nr:sigma 54-interacting transcriptional regulator [Planctomycetaceae bacterium]
MSKRRRKAADLQHWLARAATPLFILDSERRLQAFNSGCTALTGWSAAEVVGAIGHYGSVAESVSPTALVASLCPPPEVYSGIELVAPAYLVHKDGQSLPQLLHFFPLRDEKDRIEGVLGIVLPLRPPGPNHEISPARELHAELAAVRAALRARFGPNGLVAQGVVMRKVLSQMALAQETSAFVLFEGEVGTGKEHLARMIHFGGPGQANWFVPLDCRRLGADELQRVWARLLEVHRPASVGASGPQPGTVYLSDVECVPRDLQERLVKEFASTGRQSPPLRLFSATTRNLRDAVADQSVRADFLALISPLAISVPPLRERGTDLPLLAQHFLEEVNRQESKQLSGFDEAVWPLLLRYRWPGNLDELLVVIREAHDQAADSLIRPADLPFRFRTALEAQESPPPAALPPLPLDALLTKVETRLIVLALERCRNNRSKAAEMLGIHRARLLRRIEQLGLGDGGPSPEESAPSLDELSANLLQDEPRPE